LVEDWGCGKGWLTTLVERSRYRGIDGSQSPFADVIADLRTYRSAAPGIFMRHVLEHNWDWAQIPDNAIQSFTERMALIVFTPFGEETKDIAVSPSIPVPDLSFRLGDLTERFADARWTSETIATATQYGIETIFRLER